MEFAQTNLVYLATSTDVIAVTSTIFWQGFAVGFAWAGIAFAFRLVRQIKAGKGDGEI
jgi:hypothetical protein